MSVKIRNPHLFSCLNQQNRSNNLLNLRGTFLQYLHNILHKEVHLMFERYYRQYPENGSPYYYPVPVPYPYPYPYPRPHYYHHYSCFGLGCIFRPHYHYKYWY